MTECKTKVCSKCGRELPIEKFRLRSNRHHEKGYRSECKACEMDYQKKYVERQREKRAIFSDDIEMLFQRKYKIINPQRILDISDLPLVPLGTDEIFVKLMDFKDTWLSNYGRIIRMSYGHYNLLNGTFNKSYGTMYRLPKNVFVDGKWVFKQVHAYVSQLVVDTFIVNQDKKNNVYIWHRSGDKKDNCYRNLYPLAEKQYYAVREHYNHTGCDSEEYILKVMNDMRFKQDDWCSKYFRPKILGIGYHGCEEVDTNSKIYERWKNMLERCYNKNLHTNNYYKDYVNCEVCEEWHSFSNFRLWCENHEYGEKTLSLDKDILFKDNKIYSSGNCCLVTKDINLLFVRTMKDDRDLPAGVYEDKGKYRAEMSYFGQNKKLGIFEDAKSAFMAYKEEKEKLIKHVANQRKEKIPYNVYAAMMNWQIEITD